MIDRPSVELGDLLNAKPFTAETDNPEVSLYLTWPLFLIYVFDGIVLTESLQNFY